MKRAVVAIFFCAALLANAADAAADSASDQDMANRYLQAAKSGDDDARFYLGALYSAGVGLPHSDEEAFRWFSRARRSRTFARDADHGRPLCDRARRPEGLRQGIRVRHYRQPPSPRSTNSVTDPAN